MSKLTTRNISTFTFKQGECKSQLLYLSAQQLFLELVYLFFVRGLKITEETKKNKTTTNVNASFLFWIQELTPRLSQNTFKQLNSHRHHKGSIRAFCLQRELKVKLMQERNTNFRHILSFWHRSASINTLWFTNRHKSQSELNHKFTAITA